MSTAMSQQLTDNQLQQLIRNEIELGLPLVSHPYRAIANKVGVSEQYVIDTINQWQVDGLIRRFGLVIKHRQLGYTANAMVVWNVADNEVDLVAEKLAAQPLVTLCYRRPRRLPDWPYNLFCMIHGQCRQEVEHYIQQITSDLALEHIAKDILFSSKAFKQRGAVYKKTSATRSGK